MLIMVPAKRPDTIPRLNAKPMERAGKAPRAIREFGVGVSMDRLVRQTGHDSPPREDALGPAEDSRQRKREVHHQAMHEGDSKSGFRDPGLFEWRLEMTERRRNERAQNGVRIAPLFRASADQRRILEVTTCE